MGERYGRELTIGERFKNNLFGIGFFKPINDPDNILSKWFELNNNNVRPHLDQLTKGLIFRLRGTKEMNALAIEYSEILKIRFTREPDQVTPIPFSPFWILLKLGFEPRKVRWFAFSYRWEFKFGNIQVTIELDKQKPLSLVWNARYEPSVKKFFNSKYLKDKLDNNES